MDDNRNYLTAPQYVDQYQDVTGAREAERLCEILGVIFPNRDLSKERYVALFAGQAVAEKVFAETLRIPPRMVTLVDKSVPHAIMTHSDEIIVQGMRVEEFINLSTRNGDKYSLVSAFGAEPMITLFGGKLQRFIGDLSTICMKGAIVVIHPYLEDLGRNSSYSDNLWEERGFHKNASGIFQYEGVDVQGSGDSGITRVINRE